MKCCFPPPHTRTWNIFQQHVSGDTNKNQHAATTQPCTIGILSEPRGSFYINICISLTSQRWLRSCQLTPRYWLDPLSAPPAEAAFPAAPPPLPPVNEPLASMYSSRPEMIRNAIQTTDIPGSAIIGRCTSDNCHLRRCSYQERMAKMLMVYISHQDGRSGTQRLGRNLPIKEGNWTAAGAAAWGTHFL